MKKTVLSIVAAACVAGGGVAGFLIWKKNAGSRADLSAAQLLAGDTLAFAEFPDFKTSATRWRETSLGKILDEPEVRAFLERPRAQLAKNAVWAEIKTHLRNAQPHRAFLAIAGVENNMPRVVAGLSFDGPRAEIEGLLARARDRAQSASPAAKADVAQYKSFEIESISDKDVTLAGAFAGNWYFLANNVDLLKATLDRFSGEASGDSLAASEVYRKSTARLPADPEFRIFARVEEFMDRLIGLAEVQGKTIDAARAGEIRKAKAIAAATRFEGDRIRDTSFVFSPGSVSVPVLNGSTLALTSPGTLLYCAFAPIVPDTWEVPNLAAYPAPIQAVVHALGSRLNEQGIGVKEFKAAFGPEFGLLSDWGPGATSVPSVALATEVRDPALALKFAEGGCAGWEKAESNGTTLWSAPSSGGALSPAVALTPKFLIVGLNAEATRALAAKTTATGAESGTLAKSPGYTGALQTVGNPSVSLGYLDVKSTFERLYGTLRPAAMLWAGFVPNLATYVDAAKLPTTEPISKHLLPTVFSSSQTEDGFLSESTGSVTLTQGAGTLATAGAGFFFWQQFQGARVPRGAAPAPATPAPATP